jgi:bifunctional DNase/RNase
MKQVYPTTIQSGMSQTGSCLLMLHEPEGGRQIPIVIGRSEAQSILLALHPEESGRIRRPTTHQLMVEMMNTYGLTVSKVVIEKVVEGVFYATLHVSDGFNEHRIDSRTTDAVTLALLTGAPLFADERVIEETGVKVEDSRQKGKEDSLEDLEEELRRCEESEDYERAAEIQRLIDMIKQRSESGSH